MIIGEVFFAPNRTKRRNIYPPILGFFVWIIWNINSVWVVFAYIYLYVRISTNVIMNERSCWNMFLFALHYRHTLLFIIAAITTQRLTASHQVWQHVCKLVRERKDCEKKKVKVKKSLLDNIIYVSLSISLLRLFTFLASSRHLLVHLSDDSLGGGVVSLFGTAPTTDRYT